MAGIHHAVRGTVPAPTCGQHGAIERHPAQTSSQRIDRAHGPVSAVLPGMSLATYTPAWSCQRLAALPLRAVRQDLQRADGYAPGPSAPQSPLAGLRRLPAELELGTQGCTTAGYTPQYQLSLAPPLPGTGKN